MNNVCFVVEIEYVIKTKKGKVSDRKPVFSEGNIELLSKKIPEALKTANKNQDVLFEVFQLRKAFWILPSTIDTTAGYLFLEAGRINIIFEKIDPIYLFKSVKNKTEINNNWNNRGD